MAAKPYKRLIAGSPEVAGTVSREWREKGYRTEIKSHGSDSKRGTKPSFEIVVWEK